MKLELNQMIRMAVPTGVLGTAAFTICTQTADGFFPPVPPTVTKVTTDAPPPPPPVVPPTIPPVPPPPFFPPPPPPGPPTVPPPPPPPIPVGPVTIPEPATITSGIMGLLVAAGWVMKRGRGERGRNAE